MNNFIGVVAVFIILLILVVSKNDQLLVAPSQERIDMPNFNTAREAVEHQIAQDVPIDFGELSDICLYALSDGKKIRSVLTYCIADNDSAAQVALNVEYIHAASLILDDIMDRDITRRGKPTVNAKYGVTRAQLASLQLVSTAFVRTHVFIGRLCSMYGAARGNELGVALFGVLSNRLRDLGLGQYMDMNSHEIFEVTEVIHKKTSSLFELAFVNGWIARNGDLELLPAVSQVASKFGMLFQIADDIDDLETDLAKNTTTVNYVARNGYDVSIDVMRRLASEIVTECRDLDIRMQEISEVIEYLLVRAESKKKNS